MVPKNTSGICPPDDWDTGSGAVIRVKQARIGGRWGGVEGVTAIPGA